MVGLGFLPSENFVESEARAVSHSGDIVAGTVRVFEDGKSVSHGFIWQQETGMRSFYASPVPITYVMVEDMSAGGKVVVGTLSDIGNSFNSRAFRYTQNNGMQTVEEWLTEAGVDLEGWNIKSAYAVSADGNIVAGYIENATLYQPYIAWVVDDTIFGGLPGSFDDKLP